MFHLDEILDAKKQLKDIENVNALKKGRIGQTSYEVEKAIHRSNDCFVYLARHTVTDQHVIIKEFFPTIGFTFNNVILNIKRQDKELLLTRDSVEAVRLFNNLKKCYKESAINLKKAGFRNVVEVLDTFECHNTVYIVMAYIPYPTLETFIRHQVFSPKLAMSIFVTLMNVVEVIHKAGYTIKDLSMSKVYLTDSSVIIGDFNCLKRSYFISQDEKNAFIAPEVIRGDIIQSSADIYSLARVLEHLLEASDYSHNLMVYRRHKKLDPNKIAYLLKAMLEEEDRLSSISEIRKTLNHKIKDKSKRIEVAKWFLAILLVMVAIVTVKKSGLVDMFKPKADLAISPTQDLTILKMISSRTYYDFNDKQTIRWSDDYESETYRVKLSGHSVEEDLVVTSRSINLREIGLNPGRYLLEIENLHKDKVTYDFEIKAGRWLKDLNQAEIEYPKYHFYKSESQVIRWKSQYNVAMVIYDLEACRVVYDDIIGSQSVDLSELGLAAGCYKISLQNLIGDKKSLYSHMTVKIYEDDQLKAPLFRDQSPGVELRTIFWQPYKEGTMNIRLVDSTGTIYEYSETVIKGQLDLPSNMKAGIYKLYANITHNDRSSDVVEMDFRLAD